MAETDTVAAQQLDWNQLAGYLEGTPYRRVLDMFRDNGNTPLKRSSLFPTDVSIFRQTENGTFQDMNKVLIRKNSPYTLICLGDKQNPDVVFGRSTQ